MMSLNSIEEHYLLFFSLLLWDLLIFHLEKREGVNAIVNLKLWTCYVFKIKILLFFSVLREKIIISIFRSNQTLKQKGRKKQLISDSAVTDQTKCDGPYALTITEMLRRRDIIWAAPSAVQADTTNTQRHMWAGKEGTSTEAAARPISSAAFDTSRCIPQEYGYPGRERR